jgi:8-oxo-dGTP pyrophosphatase MutT (NUDIX family)
MSQGLVTWSDYAFEGKLINVRIDTVRAADDSLRQREIVEHPGAVAVVPVLPDGRIVLVRQYRPAVRRQMLELPAGTVEPDEDVAQTAQRELAEETGYRSNSVTELVRFFVSPGWCDEELVIFVAHDITPGEQAIEDDEDIDVEIVHPDDVAGLMKSGEIADSKTMVGLSLYFGFSIAAAPGSPK